jgi:hypothetical protein
MCQMTWHDSYTNEGEIMTGGMVRSTSMTNMMPHDIRMR